VKSDPADQMRDKSAGHLTPDTFALRKIYQAVIGYSIAILSNQIKLGVKILILSHSCSRKLSKSVANF